MRKLLWCGVFAGPLFVLAFLVEGALRPDYDPMRHPVSSLALGPHGWTQTVNFLLAGVLTLTFFAAYRRVSGTRRSWLIAIWGLSLLAAGVFTSDPVSGYPPDTPAVPEPTFPGRMHDYLSLVGFVALAVAMVAFMRRSTAVFDVLCLTIFVAGIFLSSAGFAQDPRWVDVAGLLQRVAVVVAWAWLARLAGSAVRHR
jgi:hypothetical membrane protein